MYKVAYEDLTEKVYKTLKEMILRKQIVPGQKLLQEELAMQLGVSRTPLLSALSKLEKEMLIEAMPRRGYFVRQLTIHQLLDIYDLRIRLEPLGVSEAAKKCQCSDIEELVSQTEAMYRISPDNFEDAFNVYDYNFHTSLMQMSGNEFLEKMISSFNIITLGNLTGMYRDPHVSLNEHKIILEAVLKQDSFMAEKAMYDHIDVARKRIKQVIREQWNETT